MVGKNWVFFSPAFNFKGTKYVIFIVYSIVCAYLLLLLFLFFKKDFPKQVVFVQTILRIILQTLVECFSKTEKNYSIDICEISVNFV